MRQVKTAQDMMKRLEELYEETKEEKMDVNRARVLVDIRKTQLRLVELNERIAKAAGKQTSMPLLGVGEDEASKEDKVQ